MEILILLMAFDTKIMMLVNKGFFSEKKKKKKMVNKGLRVYLLTHFLIMFFAKIIF